MSNQGRNMKIKSYTFMLEAKEEILRRESGIYLLTIKELFHQKKFGL